MERQIDGAVLHGKVVPAGDDLPAPDAPREYLTAEAAALIYDGAAPGGSSRPGVSSTGSPRCRAVS